MLVIFIFDAVIAGVVSGVVGTLWSRIPKKPILPPAVKYVLAFVLCFVLLQVQFYLNNLRGYEVYTDVAVSYRHGYNFGREDATLGEDFDNQRMFSSAHWTNPRICRAADADTCSFAAQAGYGAGYNDGLTESSANADSFPEGYEPIHDEFDDLFITYFWFLRGIGLQKPTAAFIPRKQ